MNSFQSLLPQARQVFDGTGCADLRSQIEAAHRDVDKTRQCTVKLCERLCRELRLADIPKELLRHFICSIQQSIDYERPAPGQIISHAAPREANARVVDCAISDAIELGLLVQSDERVRVRPVLESDPAVFRISSNMGVDVGKLNHYWSKIRSFEVNVFKKNEIGDSSDNQLDRALMFFTENSLIALDSNWRQGRPKVYRVTEVGSVISRFVLS